MGRREVWHTWKMLSSSWHHLQKLSYYEEGHSTHIRNVGVHLPSFIVSQHTKNKFNHKRRPVNHWTGYPGVCNSVFSTPARPNSSTFPVKESKFSLIFITGSTQMSGQQRKSYHSTVFTYSLQSPKSLICQMTRRILVWEVGMDINCNPKQRTMTSELNKALTKVNGVLIKKNKTIYVQT